MKKRIIGWVLSGVFLITIAPLTKAQTIEILAGNTLNGAVNGTLLGGATMALKNDSDFAPLRVGVGLGTLYGVGTAAYDLSHSKGHELLVSGLFNDGNNSTIIVLLDTFYGAAAGSIIVSAVMLVANKPIIDGLQYGAGIGAWSGFAFGLFDAFTFSKRITSNQETAYNVNSADGLLAVNFDGNTSVGLLSPSFIDTYQFTNDGLNQKITPTVQFVNLKFSF